MSRSSPPPHAAQPIGSSSKAGSDANLPKEQTRETLRRSRNILRSNARVLGRVRQKYPVKTAVYLHQLTGAPIRTCEYWLEKDRLPSEALWALFDTDEGIEYFVTGMGGARPRWMAWLVRMCLIADVVRQRAADRRRIKSLLDANNQATDLLSSGEEALLVQDENFYGHHFAAMGHGARATMGPLAEAGEEG